jgi:hypothetical protein
MPNINGQAYALTVLTPIISGQESALQEYLENLGGGAQSPLEKTGTTHLARWVIIPQLVYEGEPQKPDSLKSQYLLFESNFDGADLDAYLAILIRTMPAECDAIWRHCVGYPGVADLDKFKAYIRHNQINATFFVAAYPLATVADVRQSLAFREKFTSFVVSGQNLDAAALQNAFQKTFPVPGSAPK